MKSNLEGADRTRVWGWAWDETKPGQRVRIRVVVDGATVAEVEAATHRGDLAAAGIGDGAASFEVYLPTPLGDDTAHEVRIYGGNEQLQGSPVNLDARVAMPKSVLVTLRRAIRASVEAAQNEAELADVLAVLEQETNEARSPSNLADYRDNVAVVIDDAIPRAERDAGSQAILSHMASLRRLGFDVVFIQGSEAAADPEGAAVLREAGIRCLERADIGGIPGTFRGLRGRVRLVYLHRLSNASGWMSVARAWCPAARVIYSVAELTHLLRERMAAFRGIDADFTSLRAAELGAASRADTVITHSSFEAALLAREVPGAHVACVPWAVAPRPVNTPFKARSGVAYIGSFGQQHDIDAAEFLLRDIMPIVRASDPSIACFIVGSAVPAGLHELAGPLDVVLGRVPDIADIYRRLRVTAAPLRFAAGMKGKILESMAFGIPCVTTPVAIDGMPDVGDALCVVDGAAAAAEAILRLHSDEALASAQASAALAYISRHLSEDRIDAAMRAALA